MNKKSAKRWVKNKDSMHQAKVECLSPETKLGAGYVVMSPDIVSASSSTFEKPTVWEWSALLR